MDPNPLLWLASFLFGTALVAVLWSRYLPALRADSAGPRPSVTEAAPPPAAWLLCEEGSALDRRVRWFPLRQGGRTVLGSRPRQPEGETEYLYLAADDAREDHLTVGWDRTAGRYCVERTGEGAVERNNQALEPGERAPLEDGDTLQVGRLTRFRFTLTGPGDDGGG